MRGMKSVSNGASSSMPQDEKKENDEARHWHDEAHQTRKARLDYSLPLIEHRLGERRSRVRGNGRSSSICFFPLPRTIHTIKQRFQVPELVSIGPYYRGKASLIKFDECKWFFLDKFLFRGRALGRSLQLYLNMTVELEGRAKDCYSNLVPMLGHDLGPDFVEWCCLMVALWWSSCVSLGRVEILLMRRTQSSQGLGSSNLSSGTSSSWRTSSFSSFLTHCLAGPGVLKKPKLCSCLP